MEIEPRWPAHGTVHPIRPGWRRSAGTSWENIDPRPRDARRRYYQITPDGLELARAALARPTPHCPPAWLRPLGRSHDRPDVYRGTGQAGQPTGGKLGGRSAR